MVALRQHYDDFDGHGAVVGVIHAGGETLLSVAGLCGMGVTPEKALDMYGSLYLTIPYGIRGEQGDLEDKSQA